MKVGKTTVEFKEDMVKKDVGKGLVIGVDNNEALIYWQNESRCTWAMIDWLKVIG